MRLFAIAVLSLPLMAGSDDSFLLRNAVIHTVSGPDIPNGSVLVRDGRIVDVGAKIAPAKGVRIIEGKGLHVYPGMIDSGTTLGLTEVGAVRETNDAMEIGDFNPQLRAIVAVNPASEHIPVTRANGITSAITLPGGSLIAGQAALIRLDGWTWQDMAVNPSAFLHVVFPTIPQGRGPGSSRQSAERRPFSEVKRDYDKRVQQLHECFEQARRYQKAKQAGLAGFEPDLKLEAMLPAIEGRMPVVISANRERAIRDAIRFAGEEKIRMVLANAGEAYKFAKELKEKEIAVILGPTLALPEYDDDPYDKPYTQPAELQAAGVKIAFGTFKTSASRNLPYEAAMAVAFGLPHQEALKAVTLNPAEIWGVGDQTGSIDKGKWADLMVTTGDPFETRTEVKTLFIKGKAVDLENKHHRLYERYMARQ